MSILRTAGCWLLALALIANAGLTSPASAMTPSAHRVTTAAAPADAVAPCHEAADTERPATSDPSPTDCCKDAACVCSCVHHAPALMLSEPPRVVPRHRWVSQLGRLAALPAAPAAPPIRPPIA